MKNSDRESGPILIAAAVEEELAEIRAVASGRTNLVFAAVGCGLVEAAINTADRLHGTHPPSAVIFTGSAGSYDHSVRILTPAAASEVILADSSLALGRGYIPGLMPTRYKPDAWLLASLSTIGGQVESGAFASTVSITADRNLGTILRQELGTRFENLELFGIAAACALRNVKWGALSVITNHTHKNAHNEWNRNRQRASKVTAEVLSLWLDRMDIREKEDQNQIKANP